MKKILKFTLIYFVFNLHLNAQVFPCYQPAPSSPFATQTAALSTSSALGDFNNDGKIDMIIVNSNLSSVSTFTGNNDGTFVLAGTYTVNGNPEYIQAKDINSDTYLDLITANGSSNNISVLLGNALGTFSISTPYSVLPNGGPVGFTLADFDSDGDDDIFVSNNNRDTLSFFRNNGNGTFQPQLMGQGDQGMTGIVSADFNNDGKMDLAASSSTNNRIMVLFGDGAGGYSFSSYYSVGTATNPQAIAVLDFDNDGVNDLATANFNGSVSILFGNAQGGFSNLKNFITQNGSGILVAKDFNADGHLDLLTGNMSSNSVTMLLGNGKNGIISTRHFSVGTNPASVNAADFNNDGKMDFMAVNRNSDNIHVFLKNATSQTISGNLTTANADPINGKVILYKYYPTSTSSKLDSLDFITINANAYSFTAADSGSYILKAVPSATSLQTTYAQSSAGWKNATIVTHGCVAGSTSNFSVQAFANIGTGAGSMSGTLTQTLGFGQRPTQQSSTMAPLAPGSPIGGIIVKGGKNPGGNLFAQTETNASGGFTLTGIPNTVGNEWVYIYVDIAGLDTAGTYYKKFTNGESYNNLNFLVDSAKIRPVTTVTQPTVTVDVSVKENNFDANFTVYPNPANDVVNIEFDSKQQANLYIELLDIVGKTIHVLSYEELKQTKNNKYKVDLSHIQSGIYFLRCATNNQHKTVKLVITK